MTSDHSGHLVTVVGLGPGAFEHLTVEALEELKRADRIYVRTARHPTVEDIQAHLPHLEVHSFDAVYEVCDSFEEVYAQIVKQLFERAQLEDILYAVPGSPSVDETTVALLVELSKHNHWPVKIVQGLSYVEPVLAAAKLYDSSWTTVVDAFEIDLLASENAVGEVPGKPGRLPWRAPTPAAPLLVSQMHSR
ncbi:MAG TPA: SAM-dependent methyltransferase, partial [Chloroflexota bacterium]|nr:SAM-dependent methyltransferase [Chloroflexota bacterium]